MEMPVDILTYRFGRLVDGGAMVGDYTATALDIDEELQRKFIFIPYEEIEQVEIDTNPNGLHDFQAGSGPETIRAHKNDNPAWLYNSAVHALAMWQHLRRLEEQDRREPGVYAVTNREVNFSFTAIVTQDRRIMVTSKDSGTLLDQTEVIEGAPAGKFSWQRIDCATGTITS